MTLRDLTEWLQCLCHDGHSNDEVVAEIGGLKASTTSIRLGLREVKGEDGTHGETTVVLVLGENHKDWRRTTT